AKPLVIGWVVKEELNEYVSYTVIATGFDSASARKAVPQTQAAPEPKPQYVEPKKVVSSGFDPSQIQLDKPEDLEVPTIFRVKGNKASSLFEEGRFPQSGFQIEKITELDSDNKSGKKKEDDEDNSSSFLRMMMD
ncbi:MAG TPA: cell division protein FtsZ, partial [Ignavibacteriales bacterium]|nr:cell division protein FtsZ [Ignavibacteriales bacterium]